MRYSQLASCVVGALWISACGAEVVEAVTTGITSTGGTDDSSATSAPVDTTTPTGADTSMTTVDSTETSTSDGTASESSTGGETTATTESGTDATSTTLEGSTSGSEGSTGSSEGSTSGSEGSTSGSEGSTGSSSTSGSEGSTGGSEGSTGGSEGVCEVDPNEDDACAVCAKQACCDELSMCVDDPACACWLLCLVSGNDEAACFAQCGGQGLVELGALNDCADLNCPDDCPA